MRITINVNLQNLRTRYWLPLLIYCLLIFVLSSFSSPFPRVTVSFNDKILHAVAYLVLGFLMARSIFSLNLNPEIAAVKYERKRRLTGGGDSGMSASHPQARKFMTNRSFLFILAVSVSTLYGISDEVHQYFVPGRTASLADIVADGIGSLIGVLCYLGVREVRKVRR